MTPRERYEKMVKNAYYTYGCNYNIPTRIVTLLLVREHRRVVRKIRDLKWRYVDNTANKAYNQALDDLLAVLKGKHHG